MVQFKKEGLRKKESNTKNEKRMKRLRHEMKKKRNEVESEERRKSVKRC